MPVSKNFLSSDLNLAGKTTLVQPTALVWGPDGRLYVTEVDGDIRVLTVQFGDVDPNDTSNLASFYVSNAVTLNQIKEIQNYNDNGSLSATNNRQVTGIDVTNQYDASGQQLFIDSNGSLTISSNNGNNQPAVTMYVTSSDARKGAGPGGGDTGLDTNSGIITKLTQTGTDSWSAIDIVRGLPRSEENHATNGLEVAQKLDSTGKLISERLIVASGGNANSGAPSNNFAGQQEHPYSGAILEVDLDAINDLQVKTGSNGRKYVLDLPTLNDPTRTGSTDSNDPFGGNDGLNIAKLDYGSIVTIYSPGYRNSYDVEITEDGRIWTYDNGANNSWGGRPIGEAGGNGGKSGVNDTVDFAQAPGYIATNLNNGDGNANDDINLSDWDPSNNDNFHEITRSDDLGTRVLSVGGFGAVTTFTGPDGKTYVYGGHPNPTRAGGALAGLLFAPGSGTDNAFLLVSNQNSYGTDGGQNPNNLSDYARVINFLKTVEDDNTKFPGTPSSTSPFGGGTGDLTRKVLSVEPGVLYDIYSIAGGSGVALAAGSPVPIGGTFLGQGGLPADIAEIVDFRNPVEGDYKEAGKTDGALDSAKGSVNGLAEYKSVLLDDGNIKMSGAILATVLNGGNIIVMGRNADGTMSSVQTSTGTKAADRETISVGGGPLGIDTIGDDHLARGLNQAFQGSVWVGVYSGSTVAIKVFQPNNGTVPLAGQSLGNLSDNDFDGIDAFKDPFQYDKNNGYALAPGEKLLLNFQPSSSSRNFSGTIGDTGLLGAALDGPNSVNGALFTPGVPFHRAGATANADAITGTYLIDSGDGDPLSSQKDGLFDLAGNVIPGGNAPILQIKKVVPGTMVGAANTVRDALHTGIRPSEDVDFLVMTTSAKNWIAGSSVKEDQLTGMVFGDGTQSNFLRFVFGEVNGASGIEVGYEIGDANYSALAKITLPGLTTTTNNLIDLRLQIDKSKGFEVKAFYRLGNASSLSGLQFIEIPLNGSSGFKLPTGVLQNVLTGDHTITDGVTTLTSGAAVGVVAETSAGNILDAIDFTKIEVEAFANPAPPALVGMATLSINQTSNNVQISNFGANSFWLTNVGQKNIANVVVDFSQALYPDSVVDPFGLAGDSTTKQLQFNTPGGTGVIAPSSASYIGAGGSAGYKGLKLSFNSASSGGFNPGESIGFSVDMDPNSVRGTIKTQLDGGSSPKWDVGGVSGAELIGSTFTVTFTDGTTATGQLNGAGNQGGSQGLASQNSPNLAVNLTVNGIGSGGPVGTYGPNGPTVIVNGPAGSVARVVLTRGFIQPVTPYETFLANQLDQLAGQSFPANNAQSFQTVDVVLNGSNQNISSLFNLSGGVDGYGGQNQLPIGFVASIIDPANGNLPIGPVTKPIYLKFNSGSPSGPKFKISLFDSSPDAFVASILEGANITLGSSTPANERAIVADYVGDGVEGDDDGSIVFQLFNSSGTLIKSTTESGAPFALFGDVKGNYNNASPPLVDGSYKLTVTAYSSDGAKGSVLGTETVNFSLGSSSSQQSLSMNLTSQSINENGGSTTGVVTRSGSTATPLTVALTSSDTTEATVPSTVTIAAGQSSSSSFIVNAVNDTEDDGNKIVNINASSTGFIGGSASLTVIDDDPITGSAFKVSLYDSNPDAFVSSIINGSSITPPASTPPIERAITADYIGDGVEGDDDGSIKFKLFNSNNVMIKQTTESTAPFSLFGDIGGNYNGASPALNAGKYRLELSAFSGNNGSGTLLAIENISFTFL